MDSNSFVISLEILLENVISELSNYTELQRFIDQSVIEDELPNDLPEKTRKIVYEIQMELESIAVNQSEQLGTQRFLSRSDISKKLRKYASVLRG